MSCIAYNDAYNYQLKETYVLAIEIKPSLAIDHEYIKFDVNGNLTINKGYAWDGPSGPTFDALTFMPGSLMHDALYQLMRKVILTTLDSEKLLTASCKEFARYMGCVVFTCMVGFSKCPSFCRPSLETADNESIGGL